MLQWMGGSRRKVASTRKSIQSRQKQYFEQKRLQQQAIGGGKVFEENSLHGRHSENNRSLDVLSLQGLSKVPQDHMSTCGLATASNEVEHESRNGQTVQHSQSFGIFQPNENKPPTASKFDEAGSLSHHQSRNANTQRTSDRTPADRMKTFNSDHRNLPPEQGELCIIDMLVDEDPNFSSTKNLKPEDHAAFSIEGLRDVDMDPPSRTPVLSPKTHCRTFLHGCSSPSAAMTPAYSFDLDTRLMDLEFETETLMPEADATLRRSSMDHSFDPEDSSDLFCKSKQGFFDSEDHLPFNDNKNSFESSLTMMPEIDVMEHSFGPRDRPESLCKSKQRLFDSEDDSPFYDNKNCFNDPIQDEEPFFNSTQSNRRTWGAKPRTQLDQILDESDFPFPHNDWMDQMDASTAYVSGMNIRKKEFTFQEAYQPKSRIPMRRSGKYEPPDSPEPFMMPQRPRASHNFTLPDMSWYPPARSCHDVRDFVDERRRYEDSRDNTSLPSEESCSSSAVKGISRKGSLNSKKKGSFKNVDVTCSDNCGIYSMPSWERSSDKWKTGQARENITGQGKFTKTSNSQRSKPDFEANLDPQKRLRPDDGRLFETAFDLSKATSGRNSHFQEFEPREPLSCHSKLWFEDTFDASEDPKPYVSGLCEKYSSLPTVCSPPSNLELDEGDFRLPNLENSILRPSMTNLSEDCNVGNGNSKSSYEQSFLASEQQSTTEVEMENADVPTSEHGKSEVEGDTSSCGKSPPSKNEDSRDTAGEDDYCDSQKYTDGPAKVDYDKDTSFLPHGEEVSTVAEASGINDHVDEIIKLDTQTSLSCPTGVEEKMTAEEFHPLERKMEGKGQSSTDYSSGQVMMLNSFVMQFLCIQVMNEASAKGNRAHKQPLDEFPVNKAVVHR